MERKEYFILKLRWIVIFKLELLSHLKNSIINDLICCNVQLVDLKKIGESLEDRLAPSSMSVHEQGVRFEGQP